MLYQSRKYLDVKNILQITTNKDNKIKYTNDLPYVDGLINI